MAFFSNRHFDSPAAGMSSALPLPGRATLETALEKVGDLPVSTLTAPASMAVDDVQAAMDRRSDRDAVAILNADGVVVGVADLGLIEHRLAHPYGRSLFSNKPISRLMIRHFAILGFDDSIHTAAENFVTKSDEFRHDYFVIMRDNALWGVASVSALMTQIAFLSLRVQDLKGALSGERKQAAKSRVLEREKSRLFSIINHDVRSPLHVIMGYVDILKSEIRGKSNDCINDCIQNIEKSSHDLSSKLATIVDIAGLSANIEPSHDQFSISELINDVYLKFEERFLTQAQQLEYKESCGVSYVTCDGAAMRKILEHLFENFVDHAGPSATLSLHVTCDQLGFLLHCHDDGPGFSDAVLADLASPYGGAGDDGHSHLGPGLVIIRALVALQDGRFEASNRTPHGAEIRISLGQM